MQKLSGKLTQFLVFALKQFTVLEHGINLAKKLHLSSIQDYEVLFFSSNLKGSVDCQRIAFSGSYGNGKSYVFLRA